MLDLTPRRQDLDPIEIASRDEIAALQLARLRATLFAASASGPQAVPVAVRVHDRDVPEQDRYGSSVKR